MNTLHWIGVLILPLIHANGSGGSLVHERKISQEYDRLSKWNLKNLQNLPEECIFLNITTSNVPSKLEIRTCWRCDVSASTILDVVPREVEAGVIAAFDSTFSDPPNACTLSPIPPDCFVAPLQCPSENVTFYLYTNSSNPNHYIKLSDAESIRTAKFLESQLKILIHGYYGDKDYKPNFEIRPEYLKRGFNVVSVDYGPLVKYGCYTTAVQNTAVAAKCLAQFIEYLLETRPDIELQHIHLIGLSLGAQVAGQVRDYMTQGRRPRRISALDPALPCFYPPMTPPSMELDRGDADMVDVLHTNSGFNGQEEPRGDIDFYANGGTFQPGCLISDLRGQQFFKCSHERSSDLFAESINSLIGFRARSCYFPPPSVLGECIKTCRPTVLYGEYVNFTDTGIYAFDTADSPPYALSTNQRLKKPPKKLKTFN